MTMGWMLLAVIGSAVGVGIALLLVGMAGDQDRAARHDEKRLFPYSDVTITKIGD
jgi:hypothetical protein